MQSQYEERKRMGYLAHANARPCVDCIAYTSTITERSNAFGTAYQCETDLLCTIGGFPVKKNGTCALWTTRASAGAPDEFAIAASDSNRSAALPAFQNNAYPERKEP